MKIRSAVSWVSGCLAFAVAAKYYYLSWHFGINFPFWDDYDLFREWMEIAQSGDWGEKSEWLFRQHNEHRIAVCRALLSLYFIVFDEINFRFLPLMGGLPIIGIFFLLLKGSPFLRKNGALVLPLALILFNTANWKNMVWTQSSLSNHFILLFAGLSFYFLQRKRNPAAAFLFAVLGVFTQGSGLIIVGVGGVYLWLEGNRTVATKWFIAAIPLAVFYFWGLTHPEHHPPILQSLAHPLQMTGFAFLFFGSAPSLGNLQAGIAPGLLFFIFYGYLAVKRYYASNPFVFLFLTYMILVALAASASRSPFGIESAAAPRYQVFSLVFTALAFTAFSERFFPEGKKKVFPIAAVTLLTLAHYGTAYKEARVHMGAHRDAMVRGLDQWFFQNSNFLYPNPGFANYVLTRGEAEKFYRLPANEFTVPDDLPFRDVSEPDACGVSAKTPESSFINLIALAMGDKTVTRFERMIYPDEFPGKSGGADFLILQSKTRRYLFPVKNPEHLSSPGSKTEALRKHKFLAFARTDSIEGGLYQAGLCRNNSVQMHDLFLTVSGRTTAVIRK